MSAEPLDSGVARRVAATFGPAWPWLDRFARIAAMVMWVILLGVIASVVVRVNWPGFQGEAIKLDFTAFWGAARLALDGEALAAFHPVRLAEAMRLPPDSPEGSLLWLYPPGWHIAVTPLGLLPFSLAYILYSAISYVAFAAAVRPVSAPLPGGLALALAAPVVVINIQIGNNSLLWTAGLVAALGAMVQGRAAAAGGLIALLTLKPQLGVLIPVALLAARQWRVIGWATGVALVIAAASTAVMGADYWTHWLGTVRGMSDLMGSELVRFNLMITWYALARFWGLAHEVAFPLQLAVTLAAAAAVAWVWRRPVTADLKAATLCIAIPLATPYAWHFEMSLALVAGLFLARDGFGRSRAARLWLLLLWLGQVPGVALMHVVPPAFYAAPLLTATLGLCLWRARPGAASPAGMSAAT